MERQTVQYTILDAKAATGVGKNIYVGDFDHAVFTFDTASNANLTVKFSGSQQKESPDFSAAQTVSNQWDRIEVKDYQDGSSIDGDTGVAVTGTDDHRQLEANINGLMWINAEVTARAAGSATVTVRLYTTN